MRTTTENKMDRKIQTKPQTGINSGDSIPPP